jgi:methyl-accepting chemotaxis protein
VIGTKPASMSRSTMPASSSTAAIAGSWCGALPHVPQLARELGQAAAFPGAAAAQILGAARELSQQAEELNGEVGSFIAGVKAA